MKKTVIVLLVFVFVFIPPIVPHPVWGWACLFMLIYIINSNGTKILINDNLIRVWFAGCAIVFWGIVCSVFHYGLKEGLYLSFSMIDMLVYIPIGTMAILTLINKYRLSRKEIWECIICAGLLQSVLAITAYLIEPFQSILLYFIKNIMSVEDISYWRAYRLYGLSTSLSFGESIAQVLIGGLCFLYSKEYNCKYYFFVPFIWISDLINARVGIVALLIIISVWLLFEFKRFGERIKVSLFCVFLITIGGIIALIILLLFERFTISQRITDPIEELVSVFNGTFIPKTQGFFSYYYPGNDTLSIPLGKQLLFGGGILNNKADMGYIKNLWQGGLLFSAAVYLFYFGMIKEWYKTVRYIEDMPIIVWGFGITLFVVNIKGDAFTSLGEFINLFFFAVVLSYNYRKRSVGNGIV